MSRRYRKAVEQYLTLHAPRVLQRASVPRELVANHAQRVAELVKDDLDHAGWNMNEKPTKELRMRVERVAFPLIMTEVAPPEREQMRGVAEAEASFVALSDTILRTPTPMALRAMEGRDQLLWETQQPVDLLGGGVASSWEQVVEHHARQRAAVNVLRGLNAEGLQRADDLIVSAIRGQGALHGQRVSWYDAARVINRELSLGSFETPGSPPELSRAELEAAGEHEFLTGRNEAADRWRLRSHLYDVANPGHEISTRMPETLNATTASSLDAWFVQHSIEVYRRDEDPATRAAVDALRSLRPDRVRHLKALVQYDHTPPGAEHERLTPADLIHAVKKEVAAGTFSTPAQRPPVPEFGVNNAHVDHKDREFYHERAEADYARDLFRSDAYERQHTGGGDIHADATALRSAPLNPAPAATL